MPPTVAPEPAPAIKIIKKRTRFFGLTMDESIQFFFGGNALVAVIVLGLITLFLVREGAEFFGLNRTNLELYRKCGLEYIDIMKREEAGHSALNRALTDIRTRAIVDLTTRQKKSLAEANKALEEFDDFSGRFSDTVSPLRGMTSDLGDLAVAIKTKANVNADKVIEQEQLRREGKELQASQVQFSKIDFAAEIKPLQSTLPDFKALNATLSQQILELTKKLPTFSDPELQKSVLEFEKNAKSYVATFPQNEKALEVWDPTLPVTFWQSLNAFVFGREWITASFWQDWYGILPLLTGSLLVSFVALLIAVPLGVGAAIYVNQLASPREQKYIKPGIEFISAFPSVVLGFFGIAVLGETLRHFSQAAWLSWLPGFPIIERLNILTAGCLLALISLPTIFTLSEDAINNVPRGFKEASFALGAGKLQTILRIVVPAALSGIISAVLLGFGRVIGETMVVLLCAGNRIAIPDFSAGVGVVAQPVHTMTGIIAQEMGEVVRGSIHYRALFVIGLVLFLLSLLINYIAQAIVRRYRISIG